jgi:hypothetical protein
MNKVQVLITEFQPLPVVITTTTPIKLKWPSVNGNRRVVMAKSDDSVNEVPAGSFEYLANAN